MAIYRIIGAKLSTAGRATGQSSAIPAWRIRIEERIAKARALIGRLICFRSGNTRPRIVRTVRMAFAGTNSDQKRLYKSLERPIVSRTGPATNQADTVAFWRSLWSKPVNHNEGPWTEVVARQCAGITPMDPVIITPDDVAEASEDSVVTMALQLSRREVEDLRSSLDRAIYRTIGKSDSSLLSTVSSCLTNGYERRKIIDKISSHIDSKKASKLADKVLALAQELISSSKTQKRKHESSDKDRDTKRSRHEDREPREEKRESRSERDREEKEKKFGNGMDVPSILPEGETVGSKMAGLSADKIKLMMANAQKEIEERKRALIAMKGEQRPSVNVAAAAAQQLKVQMQQNNAIPPPSVIKPVLYSKPSAAQLTHEELEKQRKIAELQARIQRKLAGGALAAAGAAGSGPAPLILDREGRTVDTSGKRVQLTHVVPTLKANIRALRREEFRAQLAGSASVGVGAGVGGGAGVGAASWLDERVASKPPQRARRPLRFHEPGKFRQLAERLRMKAQLEKLQNEISQIARKTGISSATKLALLASDTPDSDRVPDIEWWDSVILMTPEEREEKRKRSKPSDDSRTDTQRVDACNVGADDIVDNLNEDAITNLVEHPQQLRPPSESTFF
ncbi:unnamed protein product [Parnassius apollo]|uniref:(apollo) hypothetical protein n=1 Tax=Parnassius apollo TaxID=110799 RepID=A0A8S3XM18_PARAO|nr:unnamed protein product [Parnassius apollo]